MKRVVKSDALEERLRVAAHTDGDISITCISGFLSYTVDDARHTAYGMFKVWLHRML